MTDRDRLFRVIAVDFDVPELCERIPLTRWENDRSFIDPQYSRSVCYRDVAEIHSHPGLCLQTQPYHSEALEKGLKEAAARKEVPAAVLALSALWASTTGGDTVAACLAGVHEPIARNLLTSNVPMDGRLLAELGYVDQDYKTFHLIDDPRPKQIEAAIDNAKFSNLWEQYKKLLASPKTIERVKRIPVRKEVFNPLHLRAMNRWEYLFNQMGQNLHSLELCERISWNAGTAGKDSHEFSSARLDCQRGVAEGRLDPRICALPSPRGSKIRLTPDPNDCLRGVEDGRRYMAKPAPGYRLPLQQVWYGEGWKTSLRQDIEDLGFHIQPVDESAYWKPPTVTAGRFYQYLRDEADQSDRDLFVFRVSRLPGD